MDLCIGSREIGPDRPCFIIAEVGLAHDGSLRLAHAYIDAIRRAGADCAKFQCHLGDPVAEWRAKPSWPQDMDRQAYWRRTAFTADQWQGLAEHCQSVRLEFLCSPFSAEAVELISRFVQAWKVPSGKVTDFAMLDAIAATYKPVLISTGMATPLEISKAKHVLVEQGCDVGILQCSSLYPTPPELVGLQQVASWGGLSDHSGTIYPGIAAAALGCQMLEVHVCFSKEQGGFDTAASLDMEQLRQLVEGVRFVELAMCPVDKDAMVEQLSETRRIFMGEPCTA